MDLRVEESLELSPDIILTYYNLELQKEVKQTLNEPLKLLELYEKGDLKVGNFGRSFYFRLLDDREILFESFDLDLLPNRSKEILKLIYKLSVAT